MENLSKSTILAKERGARYYYDTLSFYQNKWVLVHRSFILNNELDEEDNYREIAHTTEMNFVLFSRLCHKSFINRNREMFENSLHSTNLIEITD